MIISPNAFLELGSTLVAKGNALKRHEGKKKLEQKFRGSFGVSSDVASQLWEYLFKFAAINKKKTMPKHMLWALLFMKSYATENILMQIVGCSEKTFRFWVWHVIASISGLYDYIVSCLQTIGCGVVFTHIANSSNEFYRLTLKKD